ncbi:DUF2934 domain-containing protein [Calothrix sp. FACHB-1219]|uniref:DUF2934 domain-containing protein n=1 Tax=unclassified Calothrix TaxID=2619626 RepID=UPI0016841779|nr:MULTISPECIES: DUF2934 domain-containing protein [unclassified Calothrix]MBD2201222.1 DUF2934 domain-containing protein [Calothrix sp. FACHB-168]MBD2215656.1 DUF2934 domain-containing protein [Calothrix sp. FACHB-1219]
MPYDITLCPGQNCPIKQECYRFTAEILGRQDFFGTPPYKLTTNSCEFFITNRPNEAQIRRLAYTIWEKTGYPEGKSVEHWLQAEKELTALKNLHS